VGKPGSPMERLPAPLCGRASHLRIGSPGAAKHVPCWYPALYTREQDDLLLRERELNAREQGTRKAPTFSFPFGRIISGIVVVLGVVMVVWAIGALDAPLKVLFNGKVPTAYGCALFARL